MRVLVCDDHVMFADSLALVLRERGHDVAGVVYSPGDALRLLPHAAADVCLIDLGFPTGSALGALPGLVAAAPATAFVVLTGTLDPAAIEAALAAGARGFASKGRQADEIVDVLARVAAGEVVTEPRPGGPGGPRRRDDARRLAGYLTPREREVLVRLARGQNMATLARAMRITRSTARSHVQSVLTKLGVHSQREAVIAAVRHGLVSVDTGEWLPP
jgi:two-component system, NarL family, nitrate/nitrite response regulator NarL